MTEFSIRGTHCQINFLCFIAGGKEHNLVSNNCTIGIFFRDRKPGNHSRVVGDHCHVNGLRWALWNCNVKIIAKRKSKRVLKANESIKIIGMNVIPL